MISQPQPGLKLALASFVGAVIGVAASFAVFGDEYPNTQNFGIAPDLGAQWYQQCMQVREVRPPASDVPSQQSINRLAACEPEDLYYDTKGKSNPGKADWSIVAACAFAKDDAGVLMMLYANGFGVERNPALALKYACMTGGAPLEAEGRVDYFARMIKNHVPWG